MAHGKEACQIGVIARVYGIGYSASYLGVGNPTYVVLLLQLHIHYILLVANQLLAEKLAQVAQLVIYLYLLHGIGW